MSNGPAEIIDTGGVGSAIAANIAAVRNRLTAAGAGDVTLVAVAKTFGPEAVAEAAAAGVADIGESYAQELQTKLENLADREDIRWHFVGALQRNKIRHLAGRVHLWQSVDRPRLIEELARRDPGARILIQVNSTAEPQKAGAEPTVVPALVERAQELGLAVEGLMTIGVIDDAEATTRAFALTRGLVDDLELSTCSMGMSNDLELAVEAGSTMVRIGRDIFGDRT